MKIIIAGAGEVGTYLAKMLSTVNHDIIVIDDTHEKNLKMLDTNYDLMTVKAYPVSLSAMKEVGIKKADLFIAVTPYETANITASILAKKLGAKKTVARIDNREYIQENSQKFFEELGVDSLIYPEKLAAEEINRLLTRTAFTKVFDFSEGKLSLFVLKLSGASPLLNKTLNEVGKQAELASSRVIAITRKSKTIIPKGDDCFKQDDTLYVIADSNRIDTVMTHLGRERFKVKNIMVLGGSKIGKKTAKNLEYNFNVKLLDADKENCFELADFLDNTLVVNADGRNVNVLLEEGLADMDAFVAVTGDSETNILACMLAKKYGVRRTISEIENIDFIDLAANMGIETVINKKIIAASHIYRFTTKAKLASVQCLMGTDAEIMEFVVPKGSKVTRSAINEINFPDGAIIGGIVRGNKTLIATGACRIEADDTVVVFSLPEAINKVTRFFN